MKKDFTKKAIFTLLLLIIALGGGIVFFRFFTSSLSFAYYEPSYLPPNMTITDKEIEIGSNEKSGHELAILYVEIEERSRSTIVQSKVKAENILETMLKNNTSSECELEKTSSGQVYLLCVNEIEDRILMQEITFIKDKTALSIRLPSNKTNPHNKDEIERFIDSFAQRSTFGVRVKYVDLGG